MFITICLVASYPVLGTCLCSPFQYNISKTLAAVRGSWAIYPSHHLLVTNFALARLITEVFSIACMCPYEN